MRWESSKAKMLGNSDDVPVGDLDVGALVLVSAAVCQYTNQTK